MKDHPSIDICTDIGGPLHHPPGPLTSLTAATRRSALSAFTTACGQRSSIALHTMPTGRRVQIKNVRQLQGKLHQSSTDVSDTTKLL